MWHRERAWGVLALGALLGTRVTAQGPQPDEDAIAAAKEFSRSLGLPATNNFRHGSDKPAASYRCYFTGKLELPASYDHLQLRQSSAAGCPVNERDYDVFFYPIEAVASGDTPLTSGLATAPIERVLMVVPHEEIHGSGGIEKLGTELAEAATTLIGFRTAVEFARVRYGENSAVYRNLSREPDLFLAKAHIVNRYAAELAALYAEYRAGAISRDDALATKARIFERLIEECSAIRPQPSSFNACPAANNNAGLAFDSTYTRYYPLMYRLHEALGYDVRLTIGTLERIGRESRSGTANAVQRVEAATFAGGDRNLRDGARDRTER